MDAGNKFRGLDSADKQLERVVAHIISDIDNLMGTSAPC